MSGSFTTTRCSNTLKCSESYPSCFPSCINGCPGNQNCHFVKKYEEGSNTGNFTTGCSNNRETGTVFREIHSSREYMAARNSHNADIQESQTVDTNKSSFPKEHRTTSEDSSKIEKIKGGTGLSLCIAFVTPEKNIYLAADSFSSVPCEYGNLFSRDVRYRTVDENYQKIVHFEIAGRHVAAYSTGANEFGKEKLSLKKAAESIDLSGCKDIKDGISYICNRFFELGAAGDFQITFFSASEDGFAVTEYNYTAQSQPSDKWNTKEKSYVKNRPVLYFGGADWAQALVPYINLKTESYIESEILSAINDFFKKIIQTSKLFDNTIGGTIRIAKLTPNGFTWLQGEPT